MMNCIIVADKENCILLEEFVRKTTSLILIGTFGDSLSAKNELSKRRDIDLVFIYLETLGMDSFDFISSLDYTPNVIIISSSDQNAMKAFEYNVVDYLLKPVTYSRFYKAIDRVIKYYSHKVNSVENEIFIKKGSSLVKLKIKDIKYIEALENYVILNTEDERFTVHFTMKGIENQLPSEIFYRIHRSFIVNKNTIHTIQEDSIDIVVGETFKNIPVGKSFKDQLMNEIKLFSR